MWISHYSLAYILSYTKRSYNKGVRSTRERSDMNL